MNDIETATSNYERDRQARAKLSASNKAAVFDALAAANISEVVVEFDGEGDSGQIESVDAFWQADRIDLPSTTVVVHQVSSSDAEPVTTRPTLESAIQPSATTISKNGMAAGKTTRELMVRSASTSPNATSR